jgi:DNA helicase-2/ATP-dependent DNA helicase PcrA
MDKRVILAVAGSGKTRLIVDRLSLEKNALIVTYTKQNTLNIESRIRDKFDCIPPNIHLMTYFTFLNSFCYLPTLSYKMNTNGICWDPPIHGKTEMRVGREEHYKTRDGRIFSNRIAKAIIKFDQVEYVRRRLAKYYDEFYVDEVQDLSANDFNLLAELSLSDVDITFVGDFYQHTFDTSRDGNIQTNLHKSYEGYLKKFKDMGLRVDTTSLLKSHRCSPSVCHFISRKLGIAIESHRDDIVDVEVINDNELAIQVIEDDNIIKLFNSNAHKYTCRSTNWGRSKGEDSYGDVCVVLTAKAEKELAKNCVVQLPPTTHSKLYVACTRARGKLYFIPAKFLKPYAI